PIPRAESIDLKEVITELPPAQLESPAILPDESSGASSSASSVSTSASSVANNPQVSDSPTNLGATDSSTPPPYDPSVSGQEGSRQDASDQTVLPSPSPVIVKNEPETILSKFVL